ncbi:MAG: DNA-3-methyladenine glycosylase [Bacteroidales bacterium]|nr:DNA-3-methyladenine glycosylase [Bacteroidales bacterium]
MPDYQNQRHDKSFYERDVLEVATDLLGDNIVLKNENGIFRFRITESEAYRGEEDLACHACKGRTVRTEIMYHSGGHLYIYLIYGMYWMLNIVTGKKNQPQAVLIRGIDGISGPGRVTRHLGIDKSFYGENLIYSNRMWIEKGSGIVSYQSLPRIGIDYAGEPWKSKLWRFII